MPRLAPFRSVVQLDECFDVLAGRRLVRIRLECHHVIYRHDEEAHAGQRHRCEDCRDGKRAKGFSKGVSKAALERWGL